VFVARSTSGAARLPLSPLIKEFVKVGVILILLG
jgi:hypothetical protein